MKKSRFFSLLVTPILLEPNDQGQPNYVQATEFPAAMDAGMPLLPAELPEAMYKLYTMYSVGQGIPADYRKAAYWAEKLARCLTEELGEDHPETLNALHNLALAGGCRGTMPGKRSRRKRSMRG